jgi:hypothetical protein
MRRLDTLSVGAIWLAKRRRMSIRMKIQDCLMSSALAFKAVAMFITWYALKNYAGLIYERNPITRFLLQNDLLHVIFQLAAIAFICFAYLRVRRVYLQASAKRAIHWSFNGLVAFVFLLQLWDASNDAAILLVTSLLVPQG